MQVFDASPVFTTTTPIYYTLTREDEYVDLRHLAGLLRDGAADGSVKAAAGALFATLAQGDGNFVVQSFRQSGDDRLVSGNFWGLDNSNGVSIFFPLAPGVFGYDRYVGNQLFTFTQATQWDEFLQNYYAAAVVEPVPARDPGIPPVLRPSIPITQHCPGMDACLWGVVRFDGLPVDGAVVTLHHAGGVRSDSTTLVAANEADPIYRLRLDGMGIEPGAELALTLAYSGTQIQRTLLYDPIQLAGTREQEFNVALQDAPEPLSSAVEVGITWVMLPSSSVKPNQGTVGFHAQAASSDGSAIVEYRWRSDRVAGSLGSSSSVFVPVAQLAPGVHKITVTAVNALGIESAPVTQDLTVDPPRLYLPLVQR